MRSEACELPGGSDRSTSTYRSGLEQDYSVRPRGHINGSISASTNACLGPGDFIFRNRPKNQETHREIALPQGEAPVSAGPRLLPPPKTAFIMQWADLASPRGRRLLLLLPSAPVRSPTQLPSSTRLQQLSLTSRLPAAKLTGLIIHHGIVRTAIS